MSLFLNNGTLLLHLSPEHGGSVLNFQHKGRDILRPTPEIIPTNWKATDFAAFPMIPFCGRIRNGILKTNGRTIQLPANMPPEPHTIHGFGWQSAWSIENCTDKAATLSLTNNGTVWPWAYTATQAFELNEDMLKLTLKITNHSDTPMPSGFGWHPYFPRKDAHLRAPTIHTWSPGAKSSPARPMDINTNLDLNNGRMVEDLDLDHAFDVSTPQHAISYPDMSLNVTTDPVFRKMIVYVPKGEDYFCVEAVTHAPGTLDSSLPDTVTGVRQLKPGETLSGTVKMRVTLET